MKVSKNNYRKRIIYTFVTVSITLFIFLQSIIPGDVSATESGHVLAILNRLLSVVGLGGLFTHDFVRTCAHFAEFAVLGASLCLTCNAYCFRLRKCVLVSYALTVLVALCDECIQLFSYGRAFQISDILIDIAGGMISVALIVFFILLIRIKHKEQ